MTIKGILVSAKMDAIIDQMQEFSENDKLSMWNTYCQDTERYDDEVFYNGDAFIEMLGEPDPMWLLERAYYGNYCPTHNYVTFNGYGNFVSSDWMDELMSWDDEELAEWALENECWLIDWASVEQCAVDSLEMELEEVTCTVKDDDLDMGEVYDYVVNNCEYMEVEEAIAEYLKYIQE